MQTVIRALLFLVAVSACHFGPGYRASAGQTIIPFQERLGLILVQGSIDEQPYTFLLDTGVSETIISNELAAHLGVRTRSTVRMLDTNNRHREAPRTVIPMLRLGAFHFYGQPARIVDLAKAEGMGDLKIDGILGASLMREAYWRIDFARNEIAIFEDAARLPRGSDARFVAFEASRSGRPYVEARLGPGTTQRLLLDLGYNGELELAYRDLQRIAEQHDLYAVRARGGSTRGLFGETTSDSLLLVTIPDLQLDQVHYKALARGRHRALPKLGTKLFADQVLTLDWRRNGLYIEPATTR